MKGELKMDIGDFCNDYCLGDCHNCNPCYGCEDYVDNKCISNGGCGRENKNDN